MQVGGLSVGALEALADDWSKFLGAIHLAGRVSHPLPGLSSSPLSHPDIVSDLPGRISSATGLAPGGREEVVQGCLGDRPRSGSRLLQSPFPGGKGDRGLANRDRPLSPEQVCSSNSAVAMSGCVRTSTSRLYQAKSMLFCGWCRGRGVAPVNTTVPLIVDFLIHLRRDKGLSVSAVKGYRSALNSVFALKGMDLADSRPVSMLLRSFSKFVRPEEIRPPTWDVTLVLQSLTQAPYEPLRTSDERFLAQKMLFLLALASAKRIGEFHALLHRICHSRGWGEVSFTFVAGFLVKTQNPSSSAPRYKGFTAPALPNASTNRNGRLLCPMQAVRCYLDHTAARRLRC